MKCFITLVVLMGACGVRAMPDIHFHAKDGRLEQVKTLLREDPNLINAREEWGDTPLHWAVRTGRTEVVYFLVEQGADLHAVNQFGRTCLHVAAEANRSELITFLVDKGAEIEARNQYGDTPLHEAARCHSIQAVQTLLGLEANAESKNNAGHTPLEKAQSSRQFYINELQKNPDREDLRKGIELYEQSIQLLNGEVIEVPQLPTVSKNPVTPSASAEPAISILWEKEIEQAGRSLKPYTVKVTEDGVVRLIGVSHIPERQDPQLVEYRFDFEGGKLEQRDLLPMDAEDITILQPEAAIKDSRLIDGRIVIVRNQYRSYDLQELTIRDDGQVTTRLLPGLTRSSVSTHGACRNLNGEVFLCGNSGYIRKIGRDGTVSWDTHYQSDKGEDGTLGVAYLESEQVLCAFGMSFEPDTKFTSKDSSLWLAMLDAKGNFKTKIEFEGIVNFGKNPSFCLSLSDHPVVIYDTESELKHYNVVVSRFSKDLSRREWATPLFEKKDVMVSRMSLIPCGERHLLAAFLCLNQRSVNSYFYVLDENGRLVNHAAFENLSFGGLLPAVSQNRLFLVSENYRRGKDALITSLKLICFEINHI